MPDLEGLTIFDCTRQVVDPKTSVAKLCERHLHYAECMLVGRSRPQQRTDPVPCASFSSSVSDTNVRTPREWVCWRQRIRYSTLASRHVTAKHCHCTWTWTRKRKCVLNFGPWHGVWPLHTSLGSTWDWLATTATPVSQTNKEGGPESCISLR